MKERKTENEPLTPALSPFCGEREKRQPDARHSVRALWRCPTNRATHHVRGGQRTARPTGFMAQCTRKIERRLSMNRGTFNIQHSTPNIEGMRRIPVLSMNRGTSNESKEPSPHPDPLPSHPMGAEREQQVADELGLTDWQLASGSSSQCMRKVRNEAFHEPDVHPQVFGSARTCPRFVSTRHVASRKAATCRRTPRRCRGNWFMVAMRVPPWRSRLPMNVGSEDGPLISLRSDRRSRLCK